MKSAGLLFFLIVLPLPVAFAATSYCSGSGCDPSDGLYVAPYTQNFTPGGSYSPDATTAFAHLTWSNWPDTIHWAISYHGPAVGSMTGIVGFGFGSGCAGSTSFDGICYSNSGPVLGGVSPGELVCIVIDSSASEAVDAWGKFMTQGAALPSSAYPGFAVCWRYAPPTPRAWLGSSTMSNLFFTIGGGTCSGAGCAQFGGNETPAVEVYDASSGSWSIRSPLSSPRFGLSAATANGFIFAIGGTVASSSSALATLEAYDPGTNTWSRKTDMPTARWKLTASAVNGIVYAIGGGPGGNQCQSTNANESYDPASDIWTARSPMPTPRWGAASDVLNGAIYVVGGSLQCPQSIVTPTGTLEAYNPTTDSWVSATSMPTARWDLAAVAVGGKLYAIGGWDPISQTPLSVVEVYDPSTNAWTTKSPMPTARTGLVAGDVNGKIYVFGGNDGFKPLFTLEVYDPVTDTWSTPSLLGTTNPPSTTSISPASGSQGQTITNFTVAGTNFDLNATLSSSGSGITVNSYTSRTATQIIASITIGSTVPPGTYDVVVTNPSGQMGILRAALSVMLPPPILTSVSPGAGSQSEVIQNFTATGQNFDSNSTLLFGSNDVVVSSYVSRAATKIIARVVIAANATLGLRNVTVTNSDSQSATLNAPFHVLATLNTQIWHKLTGPWSSGCDKTFGAIAINPVNPSIVYVGSSDDINGCGVFRSTDGGNTWTAANSGLPIINIIVSQHYPPISVLSISRKLPSVLYAGIFQESTNGTVFVTLNGGKTWSNASGVLSPILNLPTIKAPVLSIAINPQNPANVVIGLVGSGVYKTSTAGVTWSQIKAGTVAQGATDYFSTVRMAPSDPKTIYIAGYTEYLGSSLPCSFEAAGCIDVAGVLTIRPSVSHDGGSTWTYISDPAMLGCPLPLHPSFPALVTDIAVDTLNKNALYASTISYIDPSSICAIPNGGAFSSLNGGNSWTPINDIGITNLSLFPIYRLFLAPNASNTLLAVTGFSGIVLSPDMGGHWISVGQRNIPYPSFIRNAAMTNTRIYALTSRGIFVIGR